MNNGGGGWNRRFNILVLGTFDDPLTPLDRVSIVTIITATITTNTNTYTHTTSTSYYNSLHSLHTDKKYL